MHRQFGLILVDRFFEPHYGQGKPEDEKRTLVVIPNERFMDWL